MFAQFNVDTVVDKVVNNAETATRKGLEFVKNDMVRKGLEGLTAAHFEFTRDMVAQSREMSKTVVDAVKSCNFTKYL